MKILVNGWWQINLAAVLAFLLLMPIKFAVDVRAVLANTSNDPTTLYLDQRYTAVPVDRQTWCGDCPGVDYTTSSPWTINPGWVAGYTPPITVEAQGGGSNKNDGCMFDSDDWFDYQTTGNVFPANATLTATECFWNMGRYGAGGVLLQMRFQSSSPDLIIKATWSWDSGSATYVYTPQPTTGKMWVYGSGSWSTPGICVWAPTPNPVPTAISVPGSHDGVAYWSIITVTISNSTDRKIAKTGGFFTTDFRSNGLNCDYAQFVYM